ncbi:MAG TPA: cyclic pyranopterin monophosphate synthase MoaC [Nitrospirota bacterium]|nr:cyclic pyranopterin monophosphate synthase MoaC [Nitrospirota bacterium]
MTSDKGQEAGPKLNHFDEEGRARMVDVSGKAETVREAEAEARVNMQPETLGLILDRNISKGDVFGVARVAGIMAAKKTPELVPLCHPVILTSVEVAFEPDAPSSSVLVRATARTTGKTGVEMEALTAAAVAGLTIYDMCKAVDRAMTITGVQLMKKTGGKSGTFKRS